MNSEERDTKKPKEPTKKPCYCMGSRRAKTHLTMSWGVIWGIALYLLVFSGLVAGFFYIFSS